MIALRRVAVPGTASKVAPQELFPALAQAIGLCKGSFYLPAADDPDTKQGVATMIHIRLAERWRR